MTRRASPQHKSKHSLLNGNWLFPPRSLRSLAEAIGQWNPDSPGKSVENVKTLLEPFGLRRYPPNHRQLWWLPLDGLPDNVRLMLEPPPGKLPGTHQNSPELTGTAD